MVTVDDGEFPCPGGGDDWCDHDCFFPLVVVELVTPDISGGGCSCFDEEYRNSDPSLVMKRLMLVNVTRDFFN